VSLHWELTSQQGIAVLAIGGALTPEDSPRLVAAVGWTSGHSDGPLILDLTALQSWGTRIHAAVNAAVCGWTRDGRRVVLVVPVTASPDLVGAGFNGVDRYPGREAAAIGLHAAVGARTVS
jgi:hypothetical protein